MRISVFFLNKKRLKLEAVGIGLAIARRLTCNNSLGHLCGGSKMLLWCMSASDASRSFHESASISLVVNVFASIIFYRPPQK